MVASSTRDLGAYDAFLEYGGRKVGLLLARDGDKNVQFSPALAPSLQPQYRTDSYGYEQTPSEIDIPYAFQDFSLGAGFEDDPNDSPSTAPRGYSYSQGVDASERSRLYLSPLRNALSAGVDQALTQFLLSNTLGYFCIGGDEIYEFAAGNWTSRDSGGGTNYTHIAEMDGVLYAARGSSADYKYSTDGTTWTAFTDSDDNFKYFATRNTSSGEAVLWGVKADGTMKSTTNGRNGGVAWSAAVAVGHTSETVNGMLNVNDDLYVFKNTGIYRYTGAATEDVWLGGLTMNSVYNGTNPYLWGDGKVYVPYGDREHAFDPNDNTITPVFPSLHMNGNPQVNGYQTARTGDGRWLYIAQKNAAGNTYIIKGNPYANDGLGEWHTYIYLGANNCTALHVAPGAASDVPSTTNPTLNIAYGTGASYYILARPNHRPEDDGAYRYDTGSTNKLVCSYTGFGALGFTKWLNSGRIVGGNLSSTEKIELLYEVDGSGSAVSILEATASGVSNENITTEVSFLRARAHVEMVTGSNTETPVGHAVVLHATPNPPRKRIWTFVVKVADDLEIRGGGRSRYSGRDLEAFLFGAVRQRCRLYDRRGTSFIVRVLDVKSVGVGDTDYATLMQTAEISQAV